MKAQVKKSVKAALLPEAIAPREVVANCDHLMKRILNVRGKMVMVDRDIADLYKVPTKVLNQAVKRNIERFPDRFRFCLTAEEKREVVTDCDHLAALSSLMLLCMRLPSRAWQCWLRC